MLIVPPHHSRWESEREYRRERCGVVCARFKAIVQGVHEVLLILHLFDRSDYSFLQKCSKIILKCYYLLYVFKFSAIIIKIIENSKFLKNKNFSSIFIFEFTFLKIFLIKFYDNSIILKIYNENSLQKL